MSYVCPKCGIELKHKGALNKHLAADNCCRTEWPCPKCGKVFENRFQLSGHLASCGVKRKKRGPYKGQKEYSKDKRKSNLTCPYCFKKFEKATQKAGHVANCKLNPRHEQIKTAQVNGQLKRWKGKHHTEATKEKIRKGRFKYLKTLNAQVYDCWLRRQQNKMSSLEQWFCDNAIIKHNLLEKHDIVNEYPEYPYFIDFAFLNVKLAVELDGKQHFIKQEQAEHDKKREAILINKGWKIFRIAYYELIEEKIQELLNVLANIKHYKPKLLKDRTYRFSEFKPPKRTRSEYFEQRRKNCLQSQAEKIKLVESSNIDFSKFGWSGQVTRLLHKRHQKVAKWMQVYCPGIWSNAFHRKSSQCSKLEADVKCLT